MERRTRARETKQEVLTCGLSISIKKHSYHFIFLITETFPVYAFLLLLRARVIRLVPSLKMFSTVSSFILRVLCAIWSYIIKRHTQNEVDEVVDEVDDYQSPVYDSDAYWDAILEEKKNTVSDEDEYSDDDENDDEGAAIEELYLDAEIRRNAKAHIAVLKQQSDSLNQRIAYYQQRKHQIDQVKAAFCADLGLDFDLDIDMFPTYEDTFSPPKRRA